MAGFVPAIYAGACSGGPRCSRDRSSSEVGAPLYDVDTRDKPGHDGSDTFDIQGNDDG
jgi:hypothetical protein